MSGPIPNKSKGIGACTFTDDELTRTLRSHHQRLIAAQSLGFYIGEFVALCEESKGTQIISSSLAISSTTVKGLVISMKNRFNVD